MVRAPCLWVAGLRAAESGLLAAQCLCDGAAVNPFSRSGCQPAISHGCCLALLAGAVGPDADVPIHGFVASPSVLPLCHFHHRAPGAFGMLGCHHLTVQLFDTSVVSFFSQ